MKGAGMVRSGIAGLLAAVCVGCRPAATGGAGPASGGQGSAAVESAGLRLRLTNVSGRRSGSRLHLAVGLEAENRGTAPVELKPPLVRLRNGGREEPVFTGPLLAPPRLAAGTSGRVEVHFDVGPDLAGEVVLETPGGPVPLKAAGAFGLESLAGDRMMALPSPPWVKP